jgi:uncharacterized damage-inducible protein DinB
MCASLLGQLAGEHRTTIAVVKHALDDKLGYSPHEKMRSFSELSQHIYLAGVWFADIMTTGKVDFGAEGKPEPQTKKDALLAKCEALNRETINKISHLSPEALARPVEFPSMGPFASVIYLGWHLHHLIHHRGQLSVYLRLMGAKVPSIYGPTLDYPNME